MASQDTRTSSAFPNNGSKVAHAKLEQLRKEPTAAVLLDKLVSASNTPNGSTPFVNRGIDLPNDSLLRKVADITATNVNDAASMMQLLPDTELVEQILVSCILSPEDMQETDLIYTSNMEIKDNDLSGALLKEIETYYDQTYKIRPLLNDWLKDALFQVGCYPMVIIPENVLDAAINSPANVTTESLRPAFDARTGALPSIGILGNPTDGGSAGTMVTLESFTALGRPEGYEPKVNVSLERYNEALDHSKLYANVDSKYQDAAKAIKAKLTLESINLSVTDNPNILKLPLVAESLRAQRVQEAFSKIHTRVGRFSMESEDKSGGPKEEKPNRSPYGIKDDKIQFIDGDAHSEAGSGTEEDDKPAPQEVSINELERAVYKYRRYKNVPVLPLMPISDRDRPSIGHPLVMKVPSEAMIPVHVPSNPQQHVGYFILIDINGNFLTRATQTDYYTDLTTNLNANQEMISQLLATTKRAEYGRDTNREIDQDEIMRVYSELVEKDLLSRLRNGIYGENVEIARPMEVYQVMLSRALAKMHTQLLYIPAEFVTYVAFDYNKYGVGQSLLQKNKLLGGMRSMLLFANSMAAIKNSIQRVVLNIQLDQDDPNPANTVEFMLHEYAKTRQASYPLGASNPLDIVSFLQNAGVEVAVSGNTRYPETKLSIEDKTSQHAKPDSDFEESLRKRFIQGCGLTPEMVDAASGAEFATTVVRNHLIMAKRVKDYQLVLMGFAKEFVQKYTINSSILLEKLIDVINANQNRIPKEYHHEPKDGAGKSVKDDASPAQRYLTEFLKTLDLSLPSPNVAEQSTQFEAYQKFCDFLEKALDAYLDPDAVDQTVFGDYASVMPSIRKSIEMFFKRQYLRQQGILPELDDIVLMDENAKSKVNLLEVQEGHAKGLMEAIGEYAKKLIKWRVAHPMPTDQPQDNGQDNGQGGDQSQQPQGDYDADGNYSPGGGYDENGNQVTPDNGTGTGDDLGGFDESGNPTGSDTGETGEGTGEEGNESGASETGSGAPEGGTEEEVGAGSPEASGASPEASGGSEEASGASEEASGASEEASGGSEEASGGSEEASGASEEASGESTPASGTEEEEEEEEPETPAPGESPNASGGSENASGSTEKTKSESEEASGEEGEEESES